jgi:VanZ family protein
MTVANRTRGRVAVILAIYSAIAVFVGVVPRPIDRGITPWIRGRLADLHRHGLRGWIDYDFVEYAAHVVLFVPFGILAVVAVGRRLSWLAVLAGFGLSALVEFWPSVAGARSAPSMLDLLLNVVGVVIGAAIGYSVLVGLGRVSRADGTS